MFDLLLLPLFEALGVSLDFELPRRQFLHGGRVFVFALDELFVPRFEFVLAFLQGLTLLVLLADQGLHRRVLPFDRLGLGLHLGTLRCDLLLARVEGVLAPQWLVARAMGVSAHHLRGSLLLEAALSGLVAAALALLVSGLLLVIGARALAGTLAPILGAAPTLAMPSWLVIAVLGITPLAAVVAAAVPTRGATAASIAAALRR